MIVGGAALVGGVVSSQGAKDASKAQAGASGQAINEQRRQFDTLLSLTAPQRNIGNQALATLGGVYGYSPTAGGTGLPASYGANGLYQPQFGTPNINDTTIGKTATNLFNPGGSAFELLGVKPNSTLGKIVDPLGGTLGKIFGSTHGDEKRNINAFMQAFPGIMDMGNGMVALPDGTQLPASQLQQLAGTWYGATFAPDGDQAGWQQKYNAMLGGLKSSPLNANRANVGQAGNGLTSDGVQQGFTANQGMTPTGQPTGNGLTAPDYSAFYKSPDYNFRMKEGLSAVQNSAAADGGLYSGNALRGIEDYGQGVAAGGFNDWFKNQLALAGIGTGATSQAGQGAIAMGANVGNLLIDQGNARASGIAGQSASWANLINQLGLLGGYKYGNALGG